MAKKSKTTIRQVQRPRVARDMSRYGLETSPSEHVPRRIVLHDTESHDIPSSIRDCEGIVEYLHSKGYGIHLVTDKDGNSVVGAPENRLVYHVGGANRGSLGIEQIGYESFSRNIWWGRPKQIMLAARWIAYWSKKYGIPIRAVRPSYCGEDVTGVLRHADVSRVCSASEGHGDPGNAYPFTFVLYLAKTLKKFGWTQ